MHNFSKTPGTKIVCRAVDCTWGYARRSELTPGVDHYRCTTWITHQDHASKIYFIVKTLFICTDRWMRVRKLQQTVVLKMKHFDFDPHSLVTS